MVVVQMSFYISRTVVILGVGKLGIYNSGVMPLAG